MKPIKIILSVFLSCALLFSMLSCSLLKGEKEQPETNESTAALHEIPVRVEGLWTNATHVESKTFGEGAKTLSVVVEAEGQAVLFTIHTDKTTVGEALLEHGLIEGDQGAYGMYVKKVNGITADYDIDQSYWSFNINGEYAMSGVDTTDITEGVTYSLVYTK